MKKITLFALLAFFASLSAQTIQVFSNKGCGCCHKWIEYIEKKGISVKQAYIQDYASFKAQHGIDLKLASCHTALIDGYFAEGHMPFEIVEWLMKEKPDIRGVAVPGMPMGSPGMEQGGVNQKYSVVAVNKDGSTRILAIYQGHKLLEKRF